ncbi:hypothetical protein Nisw_08635 [Candidatus Nitrosopumilus sp. SW]|uniref:hypothetical protein n=1 Tax=Candidatus Nitrosopumilus sp. SW TaxID=2508726 RepID=UPI001151A5AB|nr:hypothetical protein [Candidatus Nitrosopumilus sp. SW]QDI89580.1 hypothetical protein Nisw_08635 [Candidatus Nitrosopumilus sp. SW]
MKKTHFLIFVLILVSTNQAFGHKLISHDDSHRDFESALLIPDHKISWAIYENLGTNEAKFYTFDAKKGDSFYASIVIPKIEGLEDYSPSLVLMKEDNSNIQKIIYEKGFPGNEFYEPFGQVTYWERQELRTEIPSDGKYFIIVTDEKNQSGKYSLAVGEIEDFSGENMFTLLPKAWLDTKLFVNDYFSILIVFGIFIAICSIPVIVIIKKRKRKTKSFS